MKVVILAGGYGTRLAEYTSDIPKPLVKIGNEPILTHIMRFFSSFGFNNFIIAAGYKQEVIFDYYKDSIKLQKEFPNLKIVNTGKNTMTGGRILKLKHYFNENENFFMTYGDGLSDVDLNKLKKFHDSHGKIATVTAVHPPVRFGELEITNDRVRFLIISKMTLRCSKDNQCQNLQMKESSWHLSTMVFGNAWIL